jgi:hypothetical protein
MKSTFLDGLAIGTAAASALVLSLFLGPTARALDRPPLPPQAKKLTAEEIQKHYQGLRATYENYTRDVTLTGEIIYDLTGGVMFGSYVSDQKDKGLFTGKIWSKDDRFCNKAEKAKEECVTVYLDGTTYYEVDDKNQVTSVDTILDYPAKVPPSAKKVSPEEFIKASNGKRVFVTVFDYDKPIIADLKWDWKKKRVTGNFIYGGTKRGKVNTTISVDGDTVCGVNKGEKKKNCYSYYLDDGGFYELAADGKVHALSRFQ